jgi:hypothetical protein
VNSCPHRAVSKDGRIVCAKIGQGDNAVSPGLCSGCPFQSVNCRHLRFSLQLTSPSPLVVRFNGKTEVWDDDPPRLCFLRAACSELVTPIQHPRACTSCPLRTSALAPAEPVQPHTAPLPGKVVPFPAREPVAATG